MGRGRSASMEQRGPRGSCDRRNLVRALQFGGHCSCASVKTAVHHPATFHPGSSRLCDHGRGRELHIDTAIAVADAGPAGIQVAPSRLGDGRVLLASNALFTFEKIDLAPNSAWCLEAQRETWLLVVSGSARAGSFDVAMGDAVFAQSDSVNIRTGAAGLSGLLAYTG